MAMPQCCYLAKGAKRPSNTTNTIKFDRNTFDGIAFRSKRSTSNFSTRKIQPFTASARREHKRPQGAAGGNWSLGLMPFGLKSFGLIQLVTWLNFFKLSVSGIGREYDTTLFLVSVSVRFFEVSVSESFQSEIRYRYRKKVSFCQKTEKKYRKHLN